MQKYPIQFRGISARPPTAVRGGTASRLTANTLTGMPQTASSQRIGTAIGYAGSVSGFINDYDYFTFAQH